MIRLHCITLRCTVYFFGQGASVILHGSSAAVGYVCRTGGAELVSHPELTGNRRSSGGNETDRQNDKSQNVCKCTVSFSRMLFNARCHLV